MEVNSVTLLPTIFKNVKYQITKLKGDNKRLEELAVPICFCKL